MPKKQWTDEERKAFGEKMKAVREAKAAQANDDPLVDQQKAEQMDRQHLSKAAVEHGLVPPAGGTSIGGLVEQLPDEVLEAELETLTMEEFIRKHTNAQDANRDAMARVLRMTRDEVANIQRELGFPLPDGI